MSEIFHCLGKRQFHFFASSWIKCHHRSMTYLLENCQWNKPQFSVVWALKAGWHEASMSWRSSTWWRISGACCLLALQGKESHWAIIFPKPFLPFLAYTCQCHACSIAQVLGEGSGDIQFSRTQKSLCCRLRAWALEELMHQTGAARGFGVSHGCCIVVQVLSCCLPLL